MTLKTRLFAIAGAALLVQILSACQSESEEPSAARKTLDDLQQKYDELLAEKVGDPVQWAADDLENLGDWEYRVEILPFSAPEDLADQLNEFGNDKWELVWLDRTPGGFLAVLKKPSISYIGKIPLSALGKIVIGGEDSQ